MEVRAHTPFVPQCFKSRDAAGQAFDVVVVKATFDIVDDRRLKIAQQQDPVVMADRAYGAPNTSSVEHETDLKPFKPRTDLVVLGDARAPHGRATPTFFVEVALGPIKKDLRVHGPRSWRRRMGMFWALTDPSPCLRVPIRYEHAFGGTAVTDEGLVACRSNPIGVGFAPASPPSDVSELPAPQIEDPRDLIMDFGKEHAPQGLGFFGRAWEPRLPLAGTYDDAWQREQWPLPPRDFDERYHNGAHPDLQLDGPLRGGEVFSAMNMSASGATRFEVPRWQVDVRMRYRDGRIERYPTRLDTMVVDFRADKVGFAYRVRVPETGALRVVEICMREGG